jgi:hypothetical protein
MGSNASIDYPITSRAVKVGVHIRRALA